MLFVCLPSVAAVVASHMNISLDHEKERDLRRGWELKGLCAYRLAVTGVKEKYLRYLFSRDLQRRLAGELEAL